jgi:hypothetical protein
MKKLLLVVVALLVGIVVVVRRAGAGWRATDWDQRLAAMPDNFPPKWMFNNITAIRENTDRLIELQEQSSRQLEGASPDGGGTA